MSQPHSEQQNHNTYLPGYKEVGHHEWRTVENSAAYLLPTLQHLSSQNPHLTLLDVGAGSGTITASLQKYMPPNGKITAVDLSPEILSRASKHAEALGIEKGKITFRAPVSVYDLSEIFGENSFDVVHAHQMLCHLDAPVEALREMLKVARPGGVVAVREIDMRTWSMYPDTEVMRAWRRVQLASHEAAGGSNMAGPSLVSWAMKAGAKRGEIEASMGTWLYSTEEERRVWGKFLAVSLLPGMMYYSWANLWVIGTSFRDRIVGGEMRKKILDLGIATAAELDEMGREWERWMETEDATCGTIHGQILVRKSSS